MHFYLVTARTDAGTEQFLHFAETSGRAAEDVSAMFEVPCGITVVAGVR